MCVQKADQQNLLQNYQNSGQPVRRDLMDVIHRLKEEKFGKLLPFCTECNRRMEWCNTFLSHIFSIVSFPCQSSLHISRITLLTISNTNQYTQLTQCRCVVTNITVEGYSFLNYICNLYSITIIETGKYNKQIQFG